MNAELVEEKAMEIEEETEQPTAVKKSVSILDTDLKSILDIIIFARAKMYIWQTSDNYNIRPTSDK